MDPAEAHELKMLSHQKPMNDVIDRGDSPVQLLYQDTTIFLTGGTGFIGKQLIEKLFRSCAIKKMYVLMRSKKGKTIHDRFQHLLKDPVFELVCKKKPQFADRIELVEGDVANLRLGLSDDVYIKLTQEVNIFFHLAATTRFNGPLRETVLLNLRGTREMLTIAKACTSLKHFVYVSTAYTCATKDNIGKELFEKFYPVPLSPNVLIQLAEELDEEKLNGMTKHLIDGWPNVYSFTKAVAEELIRTFDIDISVCIVRPPIVICSYCEPSPGWLDVSTALTGASGNLLGGMTGVLHLLRANGTVGLPKTPVDFVNNAIIGAVWDAMERRKIGEKEIPIYTVTDKDHFVTLSSLRDVVENEVNIASAKSLYYNFAICYNGRFYCVLSWLLVYIPAYFLDAVCAIIGKRPKKIKSFVDLYKKVEEMNSIFEYFASHEWQYRNDNLVAMRKRMSEADKAIYNCDLSTTDKTDLLITWIIGVRKYIIRDDLKDSNLGCRKQTIFKLIHHIVLPLYLYVLWNILCFNINCVINVLKLWF